MRRLELSPEHRHLGIKLYLLALLLALIISYSYAHEVYNREIHYLFFSSSNIPDQNISDSTSVYHDSGDSLFVMREGSFPEYSLQLVGHLLTGIHKLEKVAVFVISVKRHHPLVEVRYPFLG